LKSPKYEAGASKTKFADVNLKRAWVADAKYQAKVYQDYRKLLERK
jgi:hypothetical protein